MAHPYGVGPQPQQPSYVNQNGPTQQPVPGYNPPPQQTPPQAPPQQGQPQQPQAQQPWQWTGYPPNGQPPAAQQAPGFDMSSRVPNAPGVPQEFVGKTWQEAFGTHQQIRDTALQLYRAEQARLRGQPPQQQPTQGQQSFVPQQPTPQPQPQQFQQTPPQPQQTPQVNVQEFMRDPNAYLQRMVEPLVEQRVNQRMEPMQAMTLQTAADHAYNTIRGQFPDFDQYKDDIARVIGNAPDKSALASPETWKAAYFYAKGERASRAQPPIPTQPNGQQQSPWGSFAERPTPTMQAYGQQQPQSQLSDAQRHYSRMLGVSDQDAAVAYDYLKRGEFPSGL